MRFMQFRISYFINGLCPEIYVIVEFITFNLVLVRFGFQMNFSFWNFYFQFHGIVHFFHFQCFPFMIRDDEVGLNLLAPTREMVRGREPCRARPCWTIVARCSNFQFADFIRQVWRMNCGFMVWSDGESPRSLQSVQRRVTRLEVETINAIWFESERSWRSLYMCEK